MIFQNNDIKKLPDSKEMGRILAMMQDSIPVEHLMPFERMIGDEDAYILTRLSNGRFPLNPILHIKDCYIMAIAILSQ